MTCSRLIGAVTCSWLIKLRLLIKLRSAYFLCFFIRNRRFALIVCFAFSHEEYHVIRVDFICSSRGRLRNLRLAVVVYLGFTNEEYLIVCVDFIYSSRGGWKETGDFDPLSLSNTSPDPGGVRCGGA